MTWTLTLTWMPWTERSQICHSSRYGVFQMRWPLQGKVIQYSSPSEMPYPAKSKHSMTQSD